MQLASKLPWELANPRWASTLNPMLANPITQGNVLAGLVLETGDNIINHGLGDTLQGYVIIMNSAPATFYDKQRTNQKPNLTLILNASGPTTVSLYVF